MSQTARSRAVAWLERYALEWVTATGFFVYFALQLPYASTDPDEGVYLAVARRMVEGQVPLRDFFVHQVPLLSWILSFVVRLGGSLTHARLFSLLCWTLAGLLLTRITSRSQRGTSLRIAALCIWFLSPLRAHIMQAIAEPPAILCLALSLYCLHRRKPLIAGPLLALALIFKAISVVMVPALLLLAYAQSPKNALKFAFGGCMAVLILVGQMLWRAPQESWGLAVTVFDYVGNSHAPPRIFALLARHNDFGLFLQNLRYDFHRGTFWQLWMVPIAVAVFIQLRSMMRRQTLAYVRTAQNTWGAVAMLLTVLGVFWFARVPIWSHYLLYYLLPMFILLAEPIETQRAIQTIKLLAVAAAAIVLAGQLPDKSLDRVYPNAAYLRSSTPSSAKLLSFYPLLDEIAQRTTACNMDDPIGNYEQVGIRRDSTPPVLHKFIVTDASIMSCLQADPGILVVKTYFYDMMASQTLKDFVATLPAARVIAMSEWR